MIASNGQAQLLLAIFLTTQHLPPSYHCLPHAHSFILPLEEHIQSHKAQTLFPWPSGDSFLPWAYADLAISGVIPE